MVRRLVTGGGPRSSAIVAAPCDNAIFGTASQRSPAGGSSRPGGRPRVTLSLDGPLPPPHVGCMGARWGSFALGLWLVFAPLLLGYPSAVAVLHDVALGLLVAVGAL